MKEPLVSSILRYALYAAFAAGVAVAVSLPFMLETYVYINELPRPKGRGIENRRRHHVSNRLSCADL